MSSLRSLLAISAVIVLISSSCLAQDLAELLSGAKNTDPHERAKAVRAMGRLQSTDAAAALVRMLADPHDHVHDEAIEALCDYKDNETLRNYLATTAIRSARDPRSLSGLARVVTELEIVEALPQLISVSRGARGDASRYVLEAIATIGKDSVEGRKAIESKLRAREWFTKAAALEALAEVAAEESLEALIEGCSDRDFRVRIAALEALEKVDKARALEETKTLLGDPHWSVRVASIRVIERSKDKSFVPLLVAQMQKEDGRLKRDIGDCLRSLASSPAKSDDGATVVTFYGITIYSKRVIFIIDLSQGMKDKAKGTTKPRIQIAQEQFVQCLKGYAPDGFFNVFGFATEVEPWKKMMQRGAVGLKNDSAKWLDKMVQQWMYARNTGRTNIHDSLALAFLDPNVDTVVFVSDATTITEGTYKGKRDIQSKIMDLNRYRKIRFHMIGVGKLEKSKPARSLMKDLAEETRGIYIEAD